MYGHSSIHDTYACSEWRIIYCMEVKFGISKRNIFDNSRFHKKFETMRLSINGFKLSMVHSNSLDILFGKHLKIIKSLENTSRTKTTSIYSKTCR